MKIQSVCALTISAGASDESIRRETMRFIHTGDIHLGAHPESKREWAANRGEEIWGTFEKLIKKIKMDPVDLLIISGDLFHRQPLLREIKEVDYLLSTIPDTKVVICAGNHDAIKKGSFYEGFQWSENVIFLEERNIQKVNIDEINTCVYGLSYHETEIEENLYDHIIVDDINKLITALKQMEFDYIIIDRNIDFSIVEKTIFDLSDSLRFVVDGTKIGNYKFLKLINSLSLVDKRENSSICQKIGIIYNKMSSSFNNTIQNKEIPVLAIVNKYNASDDKMLIDEIVSKNVLTNL